MRLSSGIKDHQTLRPMMPGLPTWTVRFDADGNSLKRADGDGARDTSDANEPNSNTTKRNNLARTRATRLAVICHRETEAHRETDIEFFYSHSNSS